MKTKLIFLFLFLSGLCQGGKEKLNVLFVCADDMNVDLGFTAIRRSRLLT